MAAHRTTADRNPRGQPLAAMLEARSIALVGASPRPGSFGQRMVDEVTRSPAAPQVQLVNPRYAEIGGRRCVPSLADLPDPVDLVLLGVPDTALEEQLSLAAQRGDAAAVLFSSAHEDAVQAIRAVSTPTPARCAALWLLARSLAAGRPARSVLSIVIRIPIVAENNGRASGVAVHPAFCPASSITCPRPSNVACHTAGAAVHRRRCAGSGAPGTA